MYGCSFIDEKHIYHHACWAEEDLCENPFMFNAFTSFIVSRFQLLPGCLIYVIESILQDVSEKITSFSLHGPWAVCVLSANGAISHASLWHSGITSGAVPYEVIFTFLYCFVSSYDFKLRGICEVNPSLLSNCYSFLFLAQFLI